MGATEQQRYLQALGIEVFKLRDAEDESPKVETVDTVDTVDSIDVTPTSATLTALGQEQQFIATALSATLQVITGVTVVWASSWKNNWLSVAGLT